MTACYVSYKFTVNGIFLLVWKHITPLSLLVVHNCQYKVKKCNHIDNQLCLQMPISTVKDGPINIRFPNEWLKYQN